MTPMVEQMAHALYACEKCRSDHADRILSLARGQPVNFHMEPWDDVADIYLSDARAALAPIIELGLQSGSLEVLSFVKMLRKGSQL